MLEAITGKEIIRIRRGVRGTELGQNSPTERPAGSQPPPRSGPPGSRAGPHPREDKVHLQVRPAGSPPDGPVGSVGPELHSGFRWAHPTPHSQADLRDGMKGSLHLT